MHFSVCVLYLAIVFKSCLSHQNVTLDDEKNVIRENQTDYEILIVKEERNYTLFNSSLEDPNFTTHDANQTVRNIDEETTLKPGVPGQLWNIIFYKVTPSTILFYFHGPDEIELHPITHYVIEYTTDPENMFYRTRQWEKNEPYKLEDLIPGTTYMFSVAARNEIGQGPWTHVDYTMPNATVPEPPEIRIVDNDDSYYQNSIYITWYDPEDVGSRILEYLIRYYKVEQGLSGWNQVGRALNTSVSGYDRSARLFELEPGTHYMIEIVARNEIGNSSPTTVVMKTLITSEITARVSGMLYIIIAAAVVFIAIVAVLIWVCVRAARKKS